MANIIIPKCDSLGKTRSEQERNLRKHWDMQTMSDVQLDKLKHIENKRRDKWGFTKQFVGLDIVDGMNKKRESREDIKKRVEENRRRFEYDKK